jgi:hypothetical protein
VENVGIRRWLLRAVAEADGGEWVEKYKNTGATACINTPLADANVKLFDPIGCALNHVRACCSREKKKV